MTRMVRRDDEVREMDLRGSKLLLHDTAPEHADRRDWKFTVVKFNLYEHLPSGKAVVPIEKDYSVAYFSALATAMFYDGEPVGPHRGQSVAFRVHLEGNGFELTAHPYRDRGPGLAWQEPDFVVSEVPIPFSAQVSNRIIELVERSEPVELPGAA
jgi:hypothetical protein